MLLPKPCKTMNAGRRSPAANPSGTRTTPAISRLSDLKVTRRSLIAYPLRRDCDALLGDARTLAYSTSPRLRGEVRGRSPTGESDWPKSLLPEAAPSPHPSRSKSDVSDFDRLDKGPKSGKPNFGCKRGEGAH